MALGGGGDIRYIISWQRAESGAVSFPVDDRLSDPGNQSFHLGFSPGATRQTTEWALIRALRPELNEPPERCPPGWSNNAMPQYCGSVCTWFLVKDKGEDGKCAPPAGSPTVITFNSPMHDDPPDEERVLRLQLNGCE